MPECACPKCVSACRRIPGLFTPMEALKAIRAGHAARLMQVGYRAGNDQRGDHFTGLMPFSEPAEYSNRPSPRYCRDAFDAHGRCTFLQADTDRCGLHRSGFKPTECSAALLCNPSATIAQHDKVRPMWNTFVGRKVVEIWTQTMEQKQ